MERMSVITARLGPLNIALIFAVIVLAAAVFLTEAQSHLPLALTISVITAVITIVFNWVTSIIRGR